MESIPINIRGLEMAISELEALKQGIDEETQLRLDCVLSWLGDIHTLIEWHRKQNISAPFYKQE